jgi:acetyl esterase/lipase
MLFQRAGWSLMIMSCLCSALIADEPARKPLPLWPKAVPGETGDIGPEGEQPLKPNDTTIRVENVAQPALTVYSPPEEKNTGTAVVICPGGGYNILAWNKEGTEVAEWLNTLGVTGIVLKYRVPVRKNRDRHAAPLEDVQRAIGLVRSKAKGWNLDPHRIGLLGFSAGGHLAAVASTNYSERAYAAVDDADRESCRPDFTLLIYPAYLVDKENRLSPELKVTSETPPTFIAMTADDGVRVEGSLFYFLALKEAKVPAEMHLYPVGGHGYGLRPSQHLVSSWPARAAEWMKASGLLK